MGDEVCDKSTEGRKAPLFLPLQRLALLFSKKCKLGDEDKGQETGLGLSDRVGGR